MNSAQRAEFILSTYLHWRVTAVGNRKIELLDFPVEGNVQKIKVRTTRPATLQEQELWDHALGLQEQLLDLREPDESGVKGSEQKLSGVDAYEVRDSLGREK